MENSKNIKKVELGNPIHLEEFVAVARYGAEVVFSEEYCRRVKKSRTLVEKWVEEERVMYGVTTGFGALCTKAIGKEETAQLQENIILTHAVSVGEPLREEGVRGIMLMVLQNLGRGNSGVRLEILEMYREFLNKGITPKVPEAGSVGYLALEAHTALVLLGKGEAWYQGELLLGEEALKRAGMKPMELSSKEGLALVSGTTSPTALGALALYDMLQAAKTADIIGALTVETLKGVMNAFDERVMKVRPHGEQAKVAENIRKILKNSKVIKKYQGSRVQDALSLRCMPQLHGASRKTLEDARRTLEIEMNSCCDNPIIWSEPGKAVITGAEIVDNWEHLEGDVWTARVSNGLFGDYNPYTTLVSGDWFIASYTAHTGEVYLNGKSMYEVTSLDQVKKPEIYKKSWDQAFTVYTWYVEQDEEKNETVFYVNFQGKNPNEETVEINVRENCFYPSKEGIGYITLSGFVVKQAATQWAPPTAYQEGMVGPHWSKGWIIEDCEISDSMIC